MEININSVACPVIHIIDRSLLRVFKLTDISNLGNTFVSILDMCLLGISESELTETIYFDTLSHHSGRSLSTVFMFGLINRISSETIH